MADEIATVTDPIADRIIGAGGIVHARTATPEFSLAMFTWSFLHGITRSPWNPAISPGGSSGGSAASLAAGTSALATGSDLGGSIRGPAALCGLIGFKPPWGRVPELWPFNRESYAASGPLARTVADTALLERVIAGPLDTDMFSLEPLALPAPIPPGRGLRVALSRDLGYFQPGPEVLAATDDAVERLRSAGMDVVEVDLEWTAEALDVAMIHVHFQTRALPAAMFGPDNRSEFTPYFRNYLNADEVSAAEWQASWLHADHMYRELQHKIFAAGHDALICPTMTTTDFPADFGHPDGVHRDLTTRDSFAIFMTYPFNILGRLPVINIPIGLSASTGVPIGLQIVGPTNADLIPFRIAAGHEEVTGPFFDRHRPPPTTIGAADPPAGG